MARIIPALHIVQMLICGLIICISLAVIGLGSDIIAYTNNHRNDDLPISWNNGYYDYHIKLPYLPPKYQLTRPVSLIIAGVICFLVNAVVVVLLLKRRNSVAKADNKKYFEFYPSMPVIALDAFAVLFALGITIYAWHDPIGKHTQRKYPPFPLYYSVTVDSAWNPDHTFEPIYWNCVMYPLMWGRFEAILPIRNLCNEGRTLLGLIIPLLVLEAAVLGLHFWLRRRMDKVFTERVARAGRSDAYSMDGVAAEYDGRS